MTNPFLSYTSVQLRFPAHVASLRLDRPNAGPTLRTRMKSIHSGFESNGMQFSRASLTSFA